MTLPAPTAVLPDVFSLLFVGIRSLPTWRLFWHFIGWRIAAIERSVFILGKWLMSHGLVTRSRGSRKEGDSVHDSIDTLPYRAYSIRDKIHYQE